MNREIKLKYWCNWCGKFIKPEDVNIDIHATDKNKLLFSHHDNHQLIPLRFTGLLDKSGKEIYEGDIVKIKQEVNYDMTNKDKVEILECIWKVEWKTEWGKIGFIIPSPSLKGKEWLLTSDACLVFPPEQEEREIIGNIYKNSELLKK